MENVTQPEPMSLPEAIVHFSNPDNCIAYIAARRWPNGVVCPICGSTKVSAFNPTRRTWKCGSHHPRREFSIKVGTIYEDSPIPLDKWLTATWMLTNCKNGVSSYEIASALRVTQKSAWFMLHRIRLALGDTPEGQMGGNDPSGAVEVDECHVGGTPKFMHAKRRMSLGTGIGGRTAKVPVVGMLDRESRQVRARMIPNVKRETLQEEVLKNIAPHSHVYTDNAVMYDKALANYVHKVVDHTQEYVRGQVHTNGIENFWSLLKRGLKGTYVAVEPFHLDRYISEQVFRFNNRATRDNPLNDADRFDIAVRQIVGKRITFAELTGKPN
jgi:transposase-like protein